MLITLIKKIPRAGSNILQHNRIRDDILLAHQLIKNYHRANTSPRCMIEVNLMSSFFWENYKKKNSKPITLVLIKF